MLNKHPLTTEMKHYSAEEFCADMDEILDSITRENTAYIIDTDKGSYVICPAEWFDLERRRESNFLAAYTVKYALMQNRETAEMVCADIRRRLYTFSYGTVEKMIDDVTAFLRDNPENDAAAAWSALVADMQDEMTRIDTVTVELTIDNRMLQDTMQYVQKRGITFQQLAETAFEALVRERPDLSQYAPVTPQAEESDKKEES